MKKLLLLSILSTLIPFALKAQTIPNAGMENWTNVGTYDSLNSWISSNLLNPIFDPQTTYPNSLFKVSPGESGSYAAQVINVVGTRSSVAYDTVSGFAIAASGTNNNPAEGFAISTRPAKLTGFYKFSQGGSIKDTAGILVAITKWNTTTQSTDTLGQGILSIFTNTSTFTSFILNITYNPAFNGVAPDTAIVGFGSSIANRPIPGTTLTVDELAFSTVTGIKTPVFGEGPIAYPNPATDNLNIKNLPSDAALIEIRNSEGILVKTENVSSLNATFSVNNLPLGLYIYTIKDNEGVLLYNDRFSIAK